METIKWGNKEYKVYEKPTRHIVIDAFEVKPKISARWNLKSDNPPRACTCDMIHLAPYKNCTIDCSFCSLPRYRGYSVLKHKEGISIVFKNYAEYLDQHIERCNFLHTFDFSADADVFMAVNRRYHIAEKTMKVLNKWGLPFNVSTKGVFTEEAIEEISKNKHSWAQISVITMDEDKRKQIIKGSDGATIEQIKENVKKLKATGVNQVTARFQPFIPYISEKPKDMIPWLKSIGFDSVVFGIMRAPMSAGKVMLQEYSNISGHDFEKLYRFKTPGYWQISNKLLHKILTEARETCDKYGMKFGLCDTYEISKNGQYTNLQEVYGNCMACETVNCYGYKRKGDKFIRVPKCIGNCLMCEESPCGYPQFFESVKYTIKNYESLR